MECSLPVNLTNAVYFVASNNIMYLNLTTVQNTLGITSSSAPTPNTTFFVSLNKSCTEKYQDEFSGNFYTLLTLSIIVLAILSLCQPRLKLWPHCCWKRPSLVVPVNLIHSSPQRLVYVCIFGAITSRLLLLILGVDVYPTPAFLQNISNPLWAKALTTFSSVFFQAMFFFPIFACVNSHIPLMGYVIGLIYTTYSWSYEIQIFGLFLTICLDTDDDDVITQYVLFAVTGLPTVIFLLIVIIWYIWKIFETSWRLCRNRTQWKSIILQHDQSTYYESHVKYLLQQHPKPQYSNVIIKYIAKVISYYYTPRAEMQYPVGFLCALVVMVTMLYQLTVSMIYFSIQFTAPLHTLRQMYSNVDDIVGVAINNTDIMESLLKSIDDSIIILDVFFVAGPLIAFIFNTVLLLHFIAVIRDHMTKLAKGDYSFFPTKRSKPSLRLLNAMRYGSYQIGYFVWAWIILCLVSWVIGLISVVLYWLIKYAFGETINIFIWLVFPLIFSLFVYLFQWISCIFLFNEKTDQKHTIIRNSRLFHWYTYALFFYNVVLGLISSMLRIFYSIGFGLLLLFRLDRVVLMKGFESYDTGHQLYIGYLYLNHTQNNPVIHVFIKLIVKTIKKDVTGFSEIELDTVSSDEYPRVSRRALIRWKVAYTLIRNPQLQQLTATFLNNKGLQSFKSKSHSSEGLEPILQSPGKQDIESNVWSSSETETNTNFRLKPIPSSPENQDIEAKPLELISPLTSETETNIHDLGLEPKSLLKPENESDNEI